MVKRVWIGWVAMVCWCGAAGQVEVKTHIRPLSFQDDEIWETLVQEIAQLETDGESLYIRSENGHIIKIDREGNFLGKIGPVGLDIGPRPHRLTGFAVWGNRSVLLAAKKDVYLFEGDRFHRHFITDAYESRFTYPHLNANGFGFDGRHIVLPARPESDRLAVAHDETGKVHARFGTVRPFPEDVSLGVEGIQATFWAWDGQHWYGLMKFRPVVLKFDRRFRLVKRLMLGGEEIDRLEEQLYFGHRDARFQQQPHFTDFKVFQGRIFVMCLNALYEIDGNLGQVLRVYRFTGKGQAFADVPPGQWLTLPFFAVLNDGTLVLAHPALMWHHDLWIAEVPLM